MDKVNYKAAFFIGLCYFLFTFGYILSTGFYHVGELLILIVTTIILAIFYAKPAILAKIKIPADSKSFMILLSIISLINIAQVGGRLGDAGQTNWQVYSAVNRILAASALIISLTYFLTDVSKVFARYRLFVLMAIAVLIRIFSIISAPNPTIDVFYILRDGPKLLLEGKNPYELSYPAPYGVYIPQILFIYGPLTTFLFIPSVILFNDPRFMLILFDLLSAFFIAKLAKHLAVGQEITNLLIVIFLFHPLFPFMTEQAWLEPAMTLFFFGATYCFLKYPKTVFGGLFLGAVLATKSVYILPVLTYLSNVNAKFYQYLTAILILIIFSLPFFVADPKLFLDRTQVYVTTPESIATNLAPTNIALNISAVILKYTKIVLPTLIVGAIGLSAALFLILKKHRNISFAIIGTFLIFMVLFMFGPFVYIHYYAFLGNLLLLTMLLFSKTI